MVTTLAVRPLQSIQATTRQSAALRMIVLSLLLLTTAMVNSCGSGGDGGDLSSSATGGDASGPASASLAWDPVGGVFGYFIHYGTQSPDSPGSCAYAESTFSSTPTATVKGLAANTTYYFAVSSFNGLESGCSAELMKVTDSI